LKESELRGDMRKEMMEME